MKNISNIEAVCYWGKERDTKLRIFSFNGINLNCSMEESVELKKILNKNKIDYKIEIINQN